MAQHPPIRISQAIDILNNTVAPRNPRSCRIVFCTADRTRDTGGLRIVFDRAVLTKAIPTKAERGKGDKYVGGSAIARRYPINVKNLTSGEIRKVHMDLIESINHHPVI